MSRTDLATQKRVGLAARTLPVDAALGLTYLGLAFVLWGSGIAPLASLKSSVIMYLPTLILTSLTWRLLRPTAQAQHLLGIGIGASLAMGAVSIFSWLSGLLNFSLPMMPWLAALLVAAVLARPRSGFNLDIKTTGLLVAFPLVTLIGIAPMWASIPATLADSSIYPDWTFHQVIGNAAQIGYRDNPLFAGNDFGYHWLGDSFGVAIERASGLDLLQGISRALYVQAVLGAAAAALSIGWAISGRAVGAAFGGISLAFGCWAFFPTDSIFLPMSTEPSPSYAASIPIALCLIALATGREWPHVPQVSILLALSTFLVVARVTTAAVVFGALLIATLATDIPCRRKWINLGVVAAGAIVGLALVGSGPSQSLAIDPNLETIRLLGLFPYTGPGSVPLGVLALISIGVAVLALGITFARAQNEHSTLLFLGGAAPIMGIAASCLTIQAGSSQITFFWAGLAIASVVMGPLALASIGARGNARGIAVVLLAGLVIASLLKACFWLTTHFGFAGFGRWAMAIGISAVISVCSLGLLTSWRLVPRSRRYNSRPPLAWSALLAAFIASGIWFGIAATAARLNEPNLLGEPSVQIDAREVEAGRWLAEQADAGEIVATNRQCQRPGTPEPSCFSAIFNVSALSGLIIDIEGVPYAVGESPSEEALGRVNDGALAAQGDAAALDRLSDRGVTWLWVDHRATPKSPNNAAYTNGLVSLVRVAK